MSKLKQSRNLFSAGFTLVELMAVVAIIGIMVSALTVSMAGARKRARVVKAQAEVREIVSAVQAYEQAHFDDSDPLPFTGNEIETTRANLAKLVGDNSEKVVYLNARFLNGVMVDPWDKPYRIRVIEQSDSDSGNEIFLSGIFVPNLVRVSE